ncbi:MAG: COG4223 family protein, partial [Paracoccaceae bacterium]
WGDRVSSFLRSQTGARSLSPREGDDPDAVLSRIEAALAAGSVADAFALMPALPEVSQAAMAEWVASAQLHLDGQQALATLTAAVGGVE